MYRTAPRTRTAGARSRTRIRRPRPLPPAAPSRARSLSHGVFVPGVRRAIFAHEPPERGGYGLGMTPAHRRLALCLWLTLGAFVDGCSCIEPRPDDALEPNDDRDHATPLTPGVAIEGRANQDNPDVFVVEAGPAQTILFELVDRGLERCPTFQVHGPDGAELVGQDLTSNCGESVDEARLAPGAALRELPDGGFEIEVPALAAGPYYLTIEEDDQADNIAPFSWDYRLTATLSP